MDTPLEGTAVSAKRVVVVILDSAGVGALPDADLYGDSEANTLRNVIETTGCSLANLEQMGLFNVVFPEKYSETGGSTPPRLYGKMASKTAGKDTLAGHWELMGVILDKPFPVYPHGFPPELIASFGKAIGRKVLGNRAASGTAIIEELGQTHLATGCPIVYTSADSVFQVAAHEDVIPIKELYRICTIARKILIGEHRVARVIARPFVGKPGSFQRTASRRDYALPPPRSTYLEKMRDAGIPVVGVGKISDIFSGRGISSTFPTKSNADGMKYTLAVLEERKTGFVFVNLIDFDMVYGHRNDPAGYAEALAVFDDFLPALKSALDRDDVLFITADHGCDPTIPGTDHTREYVPVLCWSPAMDCSVELETRETFADLGKTVAELLGLFLDGPGRGFTHLINLGTSGALIDGG